ncbi:hypothetical protein LCGC14_1407470 [marine sediment metagenome]|uniref:Phage portal protein n=1 Tax=marine sediment metagenome TaxID=412755 RepID=A0A0F9MWW3_9ZZZZ
MPDTKIDSAATGDNTSTFQDFSVAPQTTDGATDQKETKYFNDKWEQQLGYYKSVDNLQAAIDAVARWTVGKGFKSNEVTELALSVIKGHGKDTFNTILENMIRVYKIGGDSYGHIIRDNEGNLINLKPLNPGVMQIVVNRAGLIIRYEQISKGKKGVKTFKPEEIFHLSRNRTADEIHGISLIDSIEKLILAREEAMDDYKTMLHRNIYPIRDWILDTDDPVEITKFKATVAEAKYKGEDIFYPKGTVESELKGVAPNATLNPLPWLSYINGELWKAVGCSQVIVGGSGEFSEASSKISFLGHEVVITEEQLYIMGQVLSQLNLEIFLEVPATLQNELLSDQSKSETMQASTPEDTSVTNTQVTPGVPS